MKAFDMSLNKDNAVKCAINFYADNADHFGGMSVETALHKCSRIVDHTWGAMEEAFTDRAGNIGTTRHTIDGMKFGMAFRCVFMIMPVECKRIKAFLGRALLKHITTPTVEYVEFLRDLGEHMDKEDWTQEYKDTKLPANANKMLLTLLM